MKIDSTKAGLEKQIRELKAENTRLEELVITDELTGLKSRRAILDSLDQEIDRANRGKIKLCVVYIDVDNFKEVNTDYGHEQGDEVLRKVAEGLKNGTRKADSLGRLSGDEFLLLVSPETSLDENIAEKIKDQADQALSSSKAAGRGRFIVTHFSNT